MVVKPRVSRVGSSTAPWTLLNHWAKAPQPWKKATKNRHRDTPVTMSAFIMGMSLTTSKASRRRLDREYRPMAANVPAAVAIAVASRDTKRVVYRLSMMRRFWNRAEYHSREKPRHTALESPALKENTMSRKMGRYKNRNTKPMNRRLPTRLCLFT